MRNSIFSLLLVIIFVSGCASRGNFGSYCGPLPESDAVSSIALDAVNYLTALYPPGHTRVHLVPAQDASNIFAQIFENSLRAKGFTLALEDQANALVVAYALDVLFEDGEESVWYLELRISDFEKGNQSIARVYTRTGQPVAGQSQRGVEAQQSEQSREKHG